MKNRVDIPKLKRSAMVLAAIAALCTMWTTSASAQTDPFGSQYDPPPIAPPTEECGDAGSGSGGSGGAASGGAAAGCEEPGTPGDTGTAEDSGIAGTSGGSVLSEESGGPVVDLLPTTGGLPLGAALLGGSALIGAGLVAVRRRS